MADNFPEDFETMAHHHGLKENTLYKAYKKKLSDYTEWSARDYADEYLVIPENLRKHIHIDETKLGYDFYTILTTKTPNRKGTVIAIIRGTRNDTIVKRLLPIPEAERLNVEEVAMDMADNMKLVAKKAFPNAIITIDRFHVAKRGCEAHEELRLKYKKKAVTEWRKEKIKWDLKCEEAKKRNKAYRKKHPRKGKKSNRGAKVKYLKSNFIPKRFENDETMIELLTRSRFSLSRAWDKLSRGEQERLEILFREYPALEEVYVKENELRDIYNSKCTREEAEKKIDEWCKSINKCNSREIKAFRNTVKQQKEYILNYFVHGSSNALAENFNSRLKGFRALMRGISDFKFFIYRVQKIYG